MSARDTRYSFIADYFDAQASIVRQYQLLYYTQDNTIEMYDMKNKRIFLKRCAYASLSLKELFVGASVTIYSRLLKLVDYGDEATRAAFATKNEEAFVLVHGDGLYSVGSVIQQAEEAEIRIANIRLTDFSPATAKELGVSPRCYVIQMAGSEVVKKVEKLAAKSTSLTVFTNPPDMSLLNDIAIKSPSTTATMNNCAVCVIKPHAIAAGYAGSIVQRILDEGFEITALGMFTLSPADAEDFLEVYKGVVPEYKKLVEQMSSAACWSIEVRAENAVPALRAVCGPHDPDVCRVLFPHTIRAKLGTDRCKNAVHCTDLLEDGPLESEFFFSLLMSKP